MKIGLLSDTHDNLKNTTAAVRLFAQEGITTLLHCGDICGPPIVNALREFSVTFAQGNMDRSPALEEAIRAVQGPGHWASFHRLLLDGFQIALLHGDEQGLLYHLVNSGDYAYVLHGHTHYRADWWAASTRVLNPGALGGTKRESRSVCILDLETGQARFIEI